MKKEKHVDRFSIGSEIVRKSVTGHSGYGSIKMIISDRYVKEKAKEVWYEIEVTMVSSTLMKYECKLNPDKKWWTFWETKFISSPIFKDKETKSVFQLSHENLINNFIIIPLKIN